jgi:enoyl-CoA hydratase
MTYETFILEYHDHIAHVHFNRPDKANALNGQAWEELKTLFQALDQEEEARVVVLSGNGKHFCAGIDLSLLLELGQQTQESCEGRRREKLRQHVLHLQSCIDAIERCRKPVLAAIHGGCIGGGVDIVAACDMRYCTEDAYFTVKEVDMGMVADLGTLQRLPKIIPDGMAREMAYTGRKVHGPEALRIGLVNQTFADRPDLIDGVMQLAAQIAHKSPLAVRGTKEMLLHARDHSVAEGLTYIATWNAATILSEDLTKAMQAQMTKQPPVFRG